MRWHSGMYARASIVFISSMESRVPVPAASLDIFFIHTLTGAGTRETAL